MKKPTPNILGSALRDFLADHLPRLRGMSPNTILSYRDTFAILLRFLTDRKQRPAHLLDLDDLGTSEIMEFLNHLESVRRNLVSTRNVRLAGIHAFFHYVASRYPEQLERSQRILGIPFKRSRQRQMEYFEFEELDSIMSRIDRSSARGRRDYVLLAVMFNTGARVQEVLDVRARDLSLGKPFQIRLFGKGRKERFCPLWPRTARVLRQFCLERHVDLHSDAPVFVNYRGEPLTRFGVRYVLAKHVKHARSVAPALGKKRLHPHSIRHSAAVHLLKSGVDLVTISHWLGHASINTTNKYAKVDMEMKRQAIAQAKSLVTGRRSAAWRSKETILQWLEGL